MSLIEEGVSDRELLDLDMAMSDAGLPMYVPTILGGAGRFGKALAAAAQEELIGSYQRSMEILGDIYTTVPEEVVSRTAIRMGSVAAKLKDVGMDARLVEQFCIGDHFDGNHFTLFIGYVRDLQSMIYSSLKREATFTFISRTWIREIISRMAQRVEGLSVVRGGGMALWELYLSVVMALLSWFCNALAGFDLRLMMRTAEFAELFQCSPRGLFGAENLGALCRGWELARCGVMQTVQALQKVARIRVPGIFVSQWVERQRYAEVGEVPIANFVELVMTLLEPYHPRARAILLEVLDIDGDGAIGIIDLLSLFGGIEEDLREWPLPSPPRFTAWVIPVLDSLKATMESGLTYASLMRLDQEILASLLDLDRIATDLSDEGGPAEV